jgi:hypothetical protein
MGILGTIFGSKQKAAQNRAYDFLSGAYGPSTGYTGEAGSAISRFLGGDPSGFDAYKDATGFNTALSKGLQGVTGAQAAKGLLRSGSSGKAFEDYGEGLEQQYAGNYLQQLLGLGNLGLGAGQIISGAGEVGGKSGTPGLLGYALQGLSDRRAKRDIVKVGEFPDGLGIYDFTYRFDPARTVYRGVMADEVARLRPWAFIENFRDGYAGVDYGALEREAA